MSEKSPSEEQKTMDKVFNITLYFVHCTKYFLFFQLLFFHSVGFLIEFYGDVEGRNPTEGFRVVGEVEIRTEAKAIVQLLDA